MRVIGSKRIWLAAQFAFAFLASTANAATRWDLASGFDYSTGRYGAASDTSILSIPFAARLQTDRMRLELTVPYLDVHGPGSFASGVVVGGNNASTTRTGIGDVTMGAAWMTMMAPVKSAVTTTIGSDFTAIL